MIYAIKSQTDLIDPVLYKNVTLDYFWNWAFEQKEIQLDSETTGLSEINDQMICIQFGNYQDQFVIEKDILFTEENRPKLKALFEKDILFILQNALFDLKFIYRLGYFPKRIYDTFIAESCIHLGKNPFIYKKSLKAMAENYLGINLDKEIRNQIAYKGLTEDVIVYSANDVKYLQKIKNRQKELIDSEGIQRHVDLENEFVKALAYIATSGVKIDRKAWAERCVIEKEKLAQMKLDLDKIITDNPVEFKKYVNTQYDLFQEGFKSNINFNSSKQVIQLFTDLGLDLEVKDKQTGEIKKSVESTVLEPQKHLHYIVPIYLDYKSQEKICSTYGENWFNFINPVNDRVYTQYKQILNTTRMSSGGKNRSTYEEYPNLLNIPQDNSIRNCFIPQEGYCFVDCDYSSMEVRVFAEHTNEKGIIDFLNNGNGDFHSFTAKQTFKELADVSLDDIKENHKSLRQKAKAVGFSIQFGGVGATIARNANVTIEEGNKIYNDYMEGFPGVRDHFKKCKADVLKFGYIVLNTVTNAKVHMEGFKEYLGLKSKINSDFWEEFRALKELENYEENPQFLKMKSILTRKSKLEGSFERASYNWPIQGSSANIMKTACILVFNHIVETGNAFNVLFPLVIHDQIVLEVKREETGYWSDYVEKSMEKAGSYYCKKVKLTADPVILERWQK